MFRRRVLRVVGAVAGAGCVFSAGSGVVSCETPKKWDVPGVSSVGSPEWSPEMAESKYKLHPRVEVLDSRAIRSLFTVIRAKETSSKEFSVASERLMRLLAEEALTHLPSVHEEVIETAFARYRGLSLVRPDDVVLVSIVRAGDSFAEAVRHVVGPASVGKILIQRDETKAEKPAVLFYKKLPSDITSKDVLLCDPMLATGGSAIRAIDTLNSVGVPDERIVFANVVACPEGLRAMAKAHPKVKVVTAAIDECLNEDRYIVPGLGDYGDRYFGTD